MDVIVPARDEAQTIGPVIASLLAQDYAGKLRVILVDDASTDGSAGAVRRASAAELRSFAVDRLRVEARFASIQHMLRNNL